MPRSTGYNEDLVGRPRSPEAQKGQQSARYHPVEDNVGPGRGEENVPEGGGQ